MVYQENFLSNFDPQLKQAGGSASLLELHKLLCEFLDFAPGARDFVHILFITEEGGLGNPDGFESGAMCVGIFCFQEIVTFAGLRSAQSVAILAILENIQGMDGRIAGLIGNTLGVDGLNQSFGAGSSELLGVHMENVGIVPVARATRIELLRGDAGNLGEQFVEETRVLVAVQRLRVETCELDAKHRTLPLTQAVV